MKLDESIECLERHHDVSHPQGGLADELECLGVRGVLVEELLCLDKGNVKIAALEGLLRFAEAKTLERTRVDCPGSAQGLPSLECEDDHQNDQDDGGHKGRTDINTERMLFFLAGGRGGPWA